MSAPFYYCPWCDFSLQIIANGYAIPSRRRPHHFLYVRVLTLSQMEFR